MRWKKFISIWFYSRHSLLLLSLPLGFFRQRAVVEKNLFFSPFCVYYFCARLIEVLIWHGRPHSNGPIFNGKGEKKPGTAALHLSLSLQNWQTMGRHFPPGESKVSTTSGHGREEMKWCSAKRPTKGLQSRWMKKRPPEKIWKAK